MMRLLHDTIDKRRLAMMHVARNSDVANQVRTVHQIGHVLLVVDRLGQLRLERLRKDNLKNVENL